MLQTEDLEVERLSKDTGAHTMPPRALDIRHGAAEGSQLRDCLRKDFETVLRLLKMMETFEIGLNVLGSLRCL